MRLGTKKFREARRMIAAGFFKQGLGPVEVANRLGVTHGAASHWKKAWKESGEQGLVSKSHPGRSSRLTAEDRVRLAGLLADGPRSHGFATDLWTVPRVTKLIRREFGIDFDQSNVWRILRQMKWSPQKPQRRAREQDKAEVERWRTEQWPAIKKGRQK